MTGRCETCVWWKRINGLKGQGVCRLASRDQAGYDGFHPTAKARARFGLDAQLVTQFDFGCVQWESATDEAGVPFYPPNGQE